MYPIVRNYLVVKFEMKSIVMINKLYGFWSSTDICILL